MKHRGWKPDFLSTLLCAIEYCTVWNYQVHALLFSILFKQTPEQEKKCQGWEAQLRGAASPTLESAW